MTSGAIESQRVDLLAKSWSNSKLQISNLGKQEQKAPYFVIFATKYGAFLII